ncbi:RAI1-domain-containing protein [Wolfiporia cocos MD-104 SS10]|uniref:Decapping nuclease n=1 Tax=Wolfiporia cocos (strain MD-104) TaxID=742152 RepID=A0A2H3JT88_WOLCO|nr:RAI1-domain-containing protein [Wolfiporia cocos MD-104 SS10]
MSANTRKITSLDDVDDVEDRQNKRRALETTSRDRSLDYPSKSASVKAVSFQQPSPLLTFSYTPARVLEFTDSALRYYVDPPLGADLKYGYERWIRWPEEKGRIDGLVRAVLKYKERLERHSQNGSAWLNDIGVVSWRGVMTKILTAPYEERDGWELNVMIVGSTLYFEEHLSDARLVQKNDIAPHHRQQTYYGYSFESWCTSSAPRIPDKLDGHPIGWGGDVDTNVQWCSVVKTKLGDTRMVIGGEVDCVRDTFTGQTSSFVELKTSLVIRGPQDELRFEKKLLKFYFQSFLLGVPEIVVGFRTPSGRMNTIQSFKTMEIPRLVRGKPHAWDPLLCLDWGHRFITFLKSIAVATDTDDVRGDSNNEEGKMADRAKTRVWRVKFLPRVGVSVSLLDDAGVQEVQAGEDRVGFLPRWFWDGLHPPNISLHRQTDHA